MMGPIEGKLLPGNAGVLIVVGWTLVLAVIGASLLRRRDVS